MVVVENDVQANDEDIGAPNVHINDVLIVKKNVNASDEVIATVNMQTS